MEGNASAVSHRRAAHACPRIALADESAAMYIDVTENSTPDSMPLGAVNGARWLAELASRKAPGSSGA